jgi:hypothetical protein
MEKENAMDVTYLAGNIVTQAGLITVAGVLVKRWMDRVDRHLDKTQEALQSNATLLAEQVQAVHVELKFANGRTAKLEGKVAMQSAICDERSGSERISRRTRRDDNCKGE